MHEAPGKRWREQWYDLLSMHWGERRGILLLLLLLVVLSVWVVLEQWVVRSTTADLQAYRPELEAWIAARAEQHEADARPLPEPVPFNPNTIGREQWLALGFSQRQVDAIERFLMKGGRFRTKRDLARLRSLRPGQYERLEPYILLPDSLPRRTVHERTRWEPGHTAPAASAPPAGLPPPLRVELNGADSAALVALPGIGPSFAKGILKYRESLGGFVSLDQLHEVYVLQDKPEAVARIRELLTLDTLLVRRIPINRCTADELAAHPYARWKLAKPLVAYRTQHGPFRTLDGIKACQAVSEEAHRKLAPYLSLE
jgi:DNA uptake protein ComE-like DNA-binding protein